MAILTLEALRPYLSLPAVATALIALVFTSLLLHILSSVLLSPLPARIPGPFVARLTPLYAFALNLSGRRSLLVSALHAQYGPIVRLSPCEVSFASHAAVAPLYGPGAVVTKAPVYQAFGKQGLFQTTDRAAYRERVRRVGHVFSRGSLDQMEGVVQQVMEGAVGVLGGMTGAVDALWWGRAMALEVAGEVLMGRGFGTLDAKGNREGAETYLRHLDNVYVVWMLQGLVPAVMWVLKTLVPLRAVKEFVIAGEFLYAYGSDAVGEYLAREGRGKTSRRTLLTKLVAGNEETGAEPLSDDDIVIEVSNLTFAAVDTTGTEIAYTLYMLACHPDWQRRLQREIRGSGARKSGFEYRAVRDLAVLNAVVVENLRLHPAAPAGFPRQTVGPVTVIDGLALPAGVLVSMQARTSQRDPTYFPNPDRFDPSRWLAPGPDGKDQVFPGTPEMQEMMLVWGGKGGPRACIGQYMAMMEMKLLLAHLMDRFTVSLESEKTHDDMTMTDHFVLIPKGRRCGLVFTRDGVDA